MRLAPMARRVPISVPAGGAGEQEARQIGARDQKRHRYYAHENLEWSGEAVAQPGTSRTAGCDTDSLNESILHLRGERGQAGACLFGAHTRIEAPHQVQPCVARRCPHGRRHQRHRRPHVHPLAYGLTQKVRRSDTDDGEGLTVQIDWSADRVRGRTERVPPPLIADHGDLLLLLVLAERPSGGKPNF
jgi:hypothetical protein